MSNWKDFSLGNLNMNTGIGLVGYKDRLYLGYQSSERTTYALYIGSFNWVDGQPANYQSEQPPGWEAKLGIGMTVFNDQIFMAYEGTGSGGIYIASSPDGQTWGTRNHLKNWDANVGIGMTVFKKQIIMAYQGTGSGGIYIAHSDGDSWATLKHFSNWGARVGIGLTVFQDKLYMAYQGTGSGGIYLASSDDGKTWSSDRIKGWQASEGIGLASFNNRLYMAYEGTGLGDRLYVASSAKPSGDPKDWESETIPGWEAGVGVGLTPFDNKLFMVYDGTGKGGTRGGVLG